MIRLFTLDGISPFSSDTIYKIGLAAEKFGLSDENMASFPTHEMLYNETLLATENGDYVIVACETDDYNFTKRELIAKLGKNHTIILSSHILSEVQAVCKRVIIINRGHIIADDTPDNLSKVLSNDHSLVARVVGKEEDVVSALNSVKDVIGVTCLGEMETGSRDYHIQPAEGADVRADVSRRLADRQKPLLSLISNELTLEQIFLRLTGDDEQGLLNPVEALEEEYIDDYEEYEENEEVSADEVAEEGEEQ
jgi:ABC-2 type transport system ATP-binding protein